MHVHLPPKYGTLGSRLAGSDAESTHPLMETYLTAPEGSVPKFQLKQKKYQNDSLIPVQQNCAKVR